MLQKFKEKLLKRLAIAYIGIIISMIIWNFNAKWGNPFEICFSLSATTFMMIFTPFEIYWSFRDIWVDRWIRLKSEYLAFSNVNIEIEEGKFLRANLIKSKNSEKVKIKNTVIIICHGFSDTKESLQYYYYPLAQQGNVILAYDARGTGDSKDSGKRRHFLKRIDDFGIIIEWIKKNQELSEKKIFVTGFSIGAITALCGGFPNKDVEKIIAIAAVSNYKKNLPKYNPFIVLSYLMKGVNLYPNDDKNRKISPITIFEMIKSALSDEEWNKFTKKVFLIHCRNDRVIKFKNFEENNAILKLPSKNQLIFKKGGHSFKKNELALVGASLQFYNSILK